MRTVFALLGLSTLLIAAAQAGPKKKVPAPLAKAVELIDGAKRVDGTKTCTFAAKAEGCTLSVKTTCKRHIGSTALEYWYTSEIPVGKLIPAKTKVQANVGGHPGTHGLDFATSVEYPVLTDSGARSEHTSGVIGFAQGKGAAARAKRALDLLLKARKACR